MIVATEVMRIGTKADPPRLERRLDGVEPAFLELVDVFHQQNRILGHEADQEDHPDLAVQVDGCPGDLEREERAGHGEWHGDSSTVKGCTNDSNWLASTMKTTRRARANAK